MDRQAGGCRGRDDGRTRSRRVRGSWRRSTSRDLGGGRDLSSIARGAGRRGHRTVRLRPRPRRRPARAVLQVDPTSRVQGTGEAIGVRSDSSWDVPEPELVLVVTRPGRSPATPSATTSRVGRSRARTRSTCPSEGLPLVMRHRPGPVPASAITLPVELNLPSDATARRPSAGRPRPASCGGPRPSSSTYLVRALDFPDGVLLMTGTGIVPDATFTSAGRSRRDRWRAARRVHNPTHLVDVRRGSGATAGS